MSIPIVVGVTPSSGNTTGSGNVYINGSNFVGVTAVFFGTLLSPKFNVHSANRITCNIPNGVVGTVDITVVNVSGTSVTSTADQFTYNAFTSPTPYPVVATPQSAYPWI